MTEFAEEYRGGKRKEGWLEFGALGLQSKWESPNEKAHRPWEPTSYET